MKTDLLPLALLLVLPGWLWSGQFPDAAGDTTGPDLLRLEYQVANQALDLRLTFAQELEGSVIDPAVLAQLLFDADRSNLTGFRAGPGFHTRFGVDYELEVILLGFGPTSNSAVLKYWRRILSSTAPYVELERVTIALGDWYDPNGSVFVVGADATYGTDNHQVFLRVPLSLFGNESFPICGEGTVCVNNLFPCPLPLAQNLETAFLSVLAMDPYEFEGAADALPDAGMIDGASGAALSAFPADDTDLVASVTDAANDGIAQPGNNGEELTRLKVFQHAGGVLSFELQLQSYSFEDTAIYYLALDLDNNPLTGEAWANGATILGLDLLAEFANFDNPIGWPNPLEGTLYLRDAEEWCPLNYTDYLATVWRSTPGYVFMTLPSEFTAPLLAANVTGQAQAVALTADPGSLFFNDVTPNDGGLLFPASNGGQPEIEVQGNGVAIADGDATPSSTDHTDFGGTEVGTPVSRVFTVRNSGTAPLTTSGLTVPAGYTVTEGLSPSIPAGGQDTFTVQLAGTAVGTYAGEVSFTNNDTDENPFHFAITGTVRPPPPTAAEVLDFRAIWLSPERTLLQWTTGVEYDLMGFYLEQQVAEQSWVRINASIVPACGSSGPADYVFERRGHRESGLERYRLVGVDGYGQEHTIAETVATPSIALALRRQAGRLFLEVQGPPLTQVAIECSLQGVSGPWLTLAALPLDGEGRGLAWLAAEETAAMRFYRVARP